MEDYKIKRVCGFSVSSIHFSMMILPYINKELEINNTILTILENNLEKNIQEILSKITLKNELKEKILNINWDSFDIEDTSIINFLEKSLPQENNLNIIIYGKEKFINRVNEIINQVLKYSKIRKNKNIKILNGYLINNFKENITEILNKHDAVFNTSGEHKIDEIFSNINSA